MSWRDAEPEYTDEVIGETTLSRMFEDAAERHRDEPAQGYKGGVYDRSLAPDVVPAAPDGAFATVTYGETREVVRRLAAGFRELGVEADTRVGIFADTRMEWALSDFALLAAGGVVTTVYEGSSPDQVRYLLGDPGAEGVVVENRELLDRVLGVEDDLELAFVVVVDDVDADREDVFTLAEVHERGRAAYDHEAYESWLADRDLDDLASLIYTSGTTGRPKGVRLTHRNFRSNVNQVRRRFGPRPDKGPDVPSIDADTSSVSYLPLAHVFERTAGHFGMFAAGATVHYAESPDSLREDFALVSPDTATSVPRVYEKIYDAVRESASESPVKERIFRWATEVGRRSRRDPDGGALQDLKLAVADRLVFSSVREALGGEVELLVSGGGSLGTDLCDLYHAMGLPIYEGYGLTETAPVVTTNPPEAPRPGTIGPPLTGVETRLDETVVPEDQRATDEPGTVGELLVRGPNVTDGYWNKPDATADAFTDADDGDPWFRTGDIVRRRPDDYLVFRERSKQLLVLSTGKNVAPGPIEDAFAAEELVNQCMVVGDGRKFVAAVVVPNFDALARWADAEGVDLPDDPAAVAADERVRGRLQAVVDRVNERFETHEQIKRFVLAPEEFTEANDLLTPTMKKKRRNILDRYEDDIDALYED